MMDFTHASDYLNRIHHITGFYRPTQKAPGTKLFKLSEDGNNVTHAAKQKAGELVAGVCLVMKYFSLEKLITNT